MTNQPATATPRFNRLILFLLFALAVTIASQIAASQYLSHQHSESTQTLR